MTKRFSEVDGSEKVVLTFEFANGLATGETLASPVVEVTVDYGTDATPSAIAGSPQISGTDVLVPISNQKEGVDYRITVLVQTSTPAKKLALAGILPVRPA